MTMVLVGGATVPVRAEVRLSQVFGSHMVLQREKPLPVWGWADPGEKVTVQLGTATATATANDQGEWKVVLPAMPAGGPYNLTVTGSNTVQCEDVMLGEVWLCSGQSNMELGVGMADHAKEEIAAADHPMIRLLMVSNRWSPQPETNITDHWKICSPQTIAEGGWNGFSAVAYYFGRDLQQKLGVAVGLIDADWGGTRIESWTPPEGFAAVPGLSKEYQQVQLADPKSSLHQERLAGVLDDTEKWVAAARQAMLDRQSVPPMPTYPEELLPPHNVQNRTALFNGMIYPLCPFALRGAIWYQGESNNGEGMYYFERMKGLIGGWRQIWGEGDFPFYFVQIAPYNYGNDTKAQAEAEIWEAQARSAQDIPNTGMAVINDIGDLRDIHPRDKQDVGHRLALLAFAGTYGETNLVCSGPTFKSLTVEGDHLRLNFTNVGGGLASRDGKPLTWFEVIDADTGGFVPATATIDGASVVVSAPGVKHPVAVRFAWSMMAEPNLMNAEGLPASAFRAGEMPQRDPLAQIPEVKDYQLVYDLDLSQLGPNFKYSVDHHDKINGPLARVAYLMELRGDDGDTHYVYASMDAFTDDAGKIGVPTVASGAKFQQLVKHLNVYSNVKDVVTGTNLDGNIEFWPNNYAAENTANVPNASSDTFDFGDHPSDPADGYGCLQIHNYQARQTLLALNHWREGQKADLGLGNQPQGNPDWTFANNAGSYAGGRLRVFVLPR